MSIEATFSFGSFASRGEGSVAVTHDRIPVCALPSAAPPDVQQWLWLPATAAAVTARVLAIVGGTKFETAILTNTSALAPHIAGILTALEHADEDAANAASVTLVALCANVIRHVSSPPGTRATVVRIQPGSGGLEGLPLIRVHRVGNPLYSMLSVPPPPSDLAAMPSLLVQHANWVHGSDPRMVGAVAAAMLHVVTLRLQGQQIDTAPGFNRAAASGTAAALAFLKSCIEKEPGAEWPRPRQTHATPADSHAVTANAHAGIPGPQSDPRVRMATVLLMVFGAIQAVAPLATALLHVAGRRSALTQMSDSPTNLLDWTGVIGGDAGTIVFAFVQAFCGATMFLGGFAMQLRAYWWLAVLGSVLALLMVCLAPCCCVVGNLPAGVLGLVVLTDPSVRRTFK